MSVKVEVLGRSRASVGQREVLLASKALILIAYLATARHRSAPVQEIRSTLWPDRDAKRGSADLRQLAARMRARLGIDVAPTQSGRKTLELTAASLDLLRLQELGGEAMQGRFSDADAVGAELLQLYRGELLEGVEFGLSDGDITEGLLDWVVAARSQTRTQFVKALRRLVSHPSCGSTVAGRIAEALLEQDEYDEHAWTLKLRQALRHGGEHAEREYINCRDVFGRGGRDLPQACDDLKPALARGRGPHAAADQGAPAAIVTSNAASGRPKLFVTFAGNSEQVGAYEGSVYEQILLSLSQHRVFELIEKASNSSFAGGAVGYALHIGAPASRDSATAPVWLIALPDGGQAWDASGRPRGAIIWTGQLDRDWQGESSHRQVIRAVAAVLREVERSERDCFGSERRATAYRLFLMGQAEVNKVDLASLRRARSRFRDALKLDEHYAPALSGMSRTYLMEWLVRGDPDSNHLFEAWRLARLAVSADRDDARTLHRLAHVEFYRRDFDRALDLFGRAIDANPGDLAIKADFADALGHAGSPNDALSVLDDVAKADPVVAENYHWIRGSTEFTLERYDSTIRTFLNLTDPTAAARPLAAALALAGHVDEAEKYVASVRETYPGFRIADWMRMVPNRDGSDRDRYAAGLEKAGLS